MVIKSTFQNKDYFNLHKYSEKYQPLTILKKNVLQKTSPMLIKAYFLEVVFFVITNILGGLALYFKTDLAVVYLLFFTIISLNSWYSGFKYGILSIFAAVFLVFYFQGLTENYLENPILFLIPLGLLVSFLFEIIRKTPLIKSYKKREEQFSKYFVELHNENQKLKNDIRARDEFLSIASHELKSPLTSMLLQLHAMLHSIRNAPLAKFSVSDLMKTMENAEKQIKRLTKMINDLLNISLITTGRLSLEKEKVDLSETVIEVAKNHENLLKDKGIKVDIEAPKNIVGLWDKVRVEQVVTNLLSNAIKYGEGKPIDVKVSNSGSKARLEVKDRGLGIPVKEQKILFEKFLRANKTQKGLGVGLYISNQIVKAHGGLIKITSKEGKGSTFTVELPLKD